MRDKFIFYGSFYETAKKLNDEDRLALYDAIVQYSLTGVEPELEGIADIVFTAIKPTLDSQIENYKNGKKGGRPKQKTDNENKQTNEKRKDTEKEKGGLSENKKGGFEKTESYKDKDKEKEKDKDKDKEEEYNISASSKKFFESYFSKIGQLNKDLHTFRAEYEGIIFKLFTQYGEETVKRTLSAALEDNFWCPKLLEPKSLNRNFPKMKFELIDKKQNNKNLSELERAVKMLEGEAV